MSAVWQSDLVLPILAFFLKILFSIMVYPRRLDRVPCARTLLSIHSKCNRLHLLTPNSQSSLSPPHFPDNHKSVLHRKERYIYQ